MVKNLAFSAQYRDSNKQKRGNFTGLGRTMVLSEERQASAAYISSK
jgi:hypothetical protein